MEPLGQDWSFWRWLLSIAISAVCGLVGGAWWTRGIVDKVDELGRASAKRSQLELESLRVGGIERRVVLIETRCDRQKQEIMEMIRSEVRMEIRVAISEHSGQLGVRLGEITATLTGMAAHLDEARQDIVALFDRRHHHLPGAPNRRNTDQADKKG